MSPTLPSALALLAPTPLLWQVAFEDLRHHRIPNRAVVAAGAVSTVAILVASVMERRELAGAAAGGLALATTPLVIAWMARPANMGGGDVKLAAVVGALTGAIHPFVAVAVVSAALVATLVAIRWGSTLNAPLAPALAAATVVALAVHVVNVLVS